MNILLIHIQTHSGNDVFFKLLEEGLNAKAGIHCSTIRLASKYERLPGGITRGLQNQIPDATDVIVTHAEISSQISANEHVPIVAIAHHWPGNPDLFSQLSLLQKIYYRLVLDRQFRKGVSSAQHIVCVSHFTKRDIQPLLSSNRAQNVKVIHNGVDTEHFTLTTPPFHTNIKRRLFFAGNSSKRKGFDLLPGLMKQLGLNYELFYTSGLRSTKSKVSMPVNMHCLGHLTDKELKHEYQQCDALLFPSRIEGFGYSAVEAMACGKPVVGVNCGPLPEILPPALKKFQADTHCASELSQKVEALFQDPPSTEVTRDWVLQNFSLNRMATKYLQLFEEIIQ